MLLLRWSEFAGRSAVFSVTRRLRGPDGFPVHRHDFPEVFFATSGHGIHLINGIEMPLKPGTLVFIRPDDEHGFRSDDAGVVICNVAFRPGVLDAVRKRHFARDKTFWSGRERIPPHLTLKPHVLTRIQSDFAELSDGCASDFAAERFLLNLLHAVQPAVPYIAGHAPALPDWLQQALASWRGPEHLVAGTASLAKLAGRSPEHVARTVRRHIGQTPNDLLNAMRMRFAAQELATTGKKIVDIALECGLGSLGHFYALFQKHHRCSPSAYRRRRRAI